MEKQPVLQARGIFKSFFKSGVEIPVLRGVDIDLHAGERLAITGSSGAGKSTLLHVLGTLEVPNKGEVQFAGSGKNIFKYSEKDLSIFRNKVLGFVFQFHYLLPEFTAVENVMMPALIAGHNRKAAYSQAVQLLNFVGLNHRLNHRPAEMSGGEQQRVAIARAVILRPKLILADEVTGNLDSENEARVIELLNELNRSTGVSILFVTHNMDLARSMDRIIVMKDGRLLQ